MEPQFLSLRSSNVGLTNFYILHAYLFPSPCRSMLLFSLCQLYQWINMGLRFLNPFFKLRTVRKVGSKNFLSWPSWQIHFIVDLWPQPVPTSFNIWIIGISYFKKTQTLSCYAYLNCFPEDVAPSRELYLWITNGNPFSFTEVPEKSFMPKRLILCLKGCETY